ncbi:MAG: ABC transporter, permease protein 2 (cluster 1, maltose/g3p/polyamine/iron), partial [uncultured Thermomicrobiales bacterium]
DQSIDAGRRRSRRRSGVGAGRRPDAACGRRGAGARPAAAPGADSLPPLAPARPRLGGDDRAVLLDGHHLAEAAPGAARVPPDLVARGVHSRSLAVAERPDHRQLPRLLPQQPFRHHLDHPAHPAHERGGWLRVCQDGFSGPGPPLLGRPQHDDDSLYGFDHSIVRPDVAARLDQHLLGADRAGRRQPVRYLLDAPVHLVHPQRPARRGPDRRRVGVRHLLPDRDPALPSGAGRARDPDLHRPVGQFSLAAGRAQRARPLHAAARAGAVPRPRRDRCRRHRRRVVGLGHPRPRRLRLRPAQVHRGDRAKRAEGL